VTTPEPVAPADPSADARRAPSFDDVFASVADIEGWMTRDQAARLWSRASELPAGTRIVEIGSFRGRSLIVLANAKGVGVELIAIDPHGGNDRGPQEFEGFVAEAEQDNRVFEANLERAGVRDRVTHLRRYSHEALDDVDGPVDLLYIDGAHRFRPALADLRDWSAKVPEGGVMLVHDSFSAVGVTGGLVLTTFFGPRWRYEGRSQSMTQFRRTRLTPRERATNALRQIAELPWFLRNVVVKAAILARLGPVYRALGSDGTWPY
jgi:predicted O-methyltransferase YrrM